MLTVSCLRSWGMTFQRHIAIIRLAAIIFWLFLSIPNCFKCCLSFRSNQYFWIVGSVKLWKSHCGIDGFGLQPRVWQYFESQRCYAMTQNLVIVHEINTELFHWGEWNAWMAKYKLFRQFDNFIKANWCSPVTLNIEWCIISLHMFGKEAIS